MNNTVSGNEIGLLLLIHRLHQTHRPLGRRTIMPLAEIKIPDVARDYDILTDALQVKALIQGNPEDFSLTPEGKNLIDGVAEQHSLHAWFYNAYYQAVLHSHAHALFCERVYGKNLGQHGAADMEQLQFLLNALEIEGSMSSLDFGCGDGRISEYISDITQTAVSGVDIAKHAIELAQERTQTKRERLRFYWADLAANRGTFPSEEFDRIIAIDSIFFIKNQRAVLETFLDHLKPNGKMGIFYLCPGDMASEQTALGNALKELRLSYDVRDFSAQNTQHWQKKKQTLLELEPMFYDEGNEFLFKNRMAECDGALEHFHRYLFIIAPR